MFLVGLVPSADSTSTRHASLLNSNVLRDSQSTKHLCFPIPLFKQPVLKCSYLAAIRGGPAVALPVDVSPALFYRYLAASDVPVIGVPRALLISRVLAVVIPSRPRRCPGVRAQLNIGGRGRTTGRFQRIGYGVINTRTGRVGLSSGEPLHGAAQSQTLAQHGVRRSVLARRLKVGLPPSQT